MKKGQSAVKIEKKKNEENEWKMKQNRSFKISSFL